VKVLKRLKVANVQGLNKMSKMSRKHIEDDIICSCQAIELISGMGTISIE
jgi:hypothetical protein